MLIIIWLSDSLQTVELAFNQINQQNEVDGSW